MEVLSQIRFKDFGAWDVKQYLSSLIYSNQTIVRLSQYIKEEKNRIKPFESPKDDFKILGVNNKIGLFDNEIKKGSEINQPYKVVKNGFLAFNPYRINVGSIGLKSNTQQNDLISPAYVVFSCKEGLLPEYLFMIFKTNIFNQIIKDNTKGSVRQILSFDILERLQIPLPSLKIQQQLVKNYQEKLNLSKQQTEQAQQKEREIETYLYQELGIELPKAETQNTDILQFVRFKDLDYWSVEKLLLKNSFNSKYEVTNFVDICNFKNKKFNKSKHKQDFFNYIDIGSIDPLNGIEGNKKISINKAPSRATQHANTGDLIIATTRPYLKKFAIVDKVFDNDVYSSGFTVVEKNINKYNLYYIKEFMQSFYGIRQLEDNMTGGLYPAITLANLKLIQIPLPPLEIQNQIASHIQTIKDKITELRQQAEQNQANALSEFEAEIFNAS